LAVLVVFGVLSFMLDGPRQAAATTAAILGVMGLYLLVIGPIAIRNDLRGDLSFVEMLRTLPVTGGRFVAASIGGSVATLLFVELLLLLMAAVFLGFSGYTPFPAAWLFGVLPVALLVLVPILSVSLLLHNLIALFFPAWFRPGMDRSRGIEAMGLRIVTFLSGILLLVLGIGLPGLAGAVVAGPLAFSLGPWALIPGVGAFYVVVVGEIALALEVMGRRWDRLDPGEIEQRE